MDLRHRPQYHFLPLANWMNDPNGLIQVNGIYHLFYQQHPDSAGDGPKHWGHATSRDLVHWVHQPIALAPTPGGPDKGGVWSGSAVNNDGTPTAFYTGVSPEVQCLATSDDEMIVWHKSPRNPVVAGPPAGLDVTGFRDPYVWREDDGWHMVIGSGVRGQHGVALLYHSPNLLDWEYLGFLCQGVTEATGFNWECPTFLPLGDRHLLLFSPMPFLQSHYFTGSYADHRFSQQQHGILDLGGVYYAPQAFTDESGRCISIGWLLESRTKEARMASGWAGVQSLPRELTLAADGTLRQRPVPELATLRRDHVSVAPGAIKGLTPLDQVRGASLELSVELDPHQAGSVGLVVRRSPDGAEGVAISYDVSSGLLGVDTRTASLSAEAEGRLAQAPLALHGQTLTLRVFVDESVIEVFANEQVCMTVRAYPTRDDSLDVALTAEGGTARLLSLDAWRMDSIWKSSRTC